MLKLLKEETSYRKKLVFNFYLILHPRYLLRFLKDYSELVAIGSYGYGLNKEVYSFCFLCFIDYLLLTNINVVTKSLMSSSFKQSFRQNLKV